MISSTTGCAAGLVLAGMLIGWAARAEPTRGDAIAAQALFKDARALVEAGKWAPGCAKFAASLALVPSTSTRLNLARCHEHDGKLASAWQDYKEGLALNHETVGAERRKALEALALEGMAALEPRLPRLRVTVKGAPSGLEVSCDGKRIPLAALGEGLPVDPGTHEIRASAVGFKPEVRTVTLEEKKTATVEMDLVADPAAPGAPAGVPAWAWVAGAAGIGMVGAGAYFLGDDLSAIRALRTHCREASGGTSCDPGYDYQRDNARKNRGLALAVGLGGTGLFAVGAGVFGIVRGLREKRAEPPNVTATPWLVPGAAGVTIAGRF